GGFQLLCDARNEAAVAALRERKAREAKPFALMVADLDAARALAHINEAEAAALTSPEAPIVLLERRAGVALAPSLSPGLSTLGVMLPASPLHHLIAGDLGFPVVATSGNLSGEPLCIANDEALARLGKIADSLLVHNREIVRPLDDSVVRVIGGRAVTLRLGRGLAPLPLEVPAPRGNALAYGAHMKNAPALLSGKYVVLAQHVGDLDSESARAALVRAGRDLKNLFTENESGGAAAACDAHPDYGSTRVALQHSGAPLRVWHHHAHVLACMLDNEADGEVLGVSWDGTGLGPDGTIWGGEFLRVDGARFERVAHLRAFRLPGGRAAIGEPLRVTAALLHDIYGEDLPRVGPFADEALRKKARLWASLPNAPTTTSAGRLFEAVAALLGLCEKNRYEGETAMRLESIAAGDDDSAYELALVSGEAIVLDWEPLIRAIMRDLEAGEGAPAIAAHFHGALARAIAEVATKLKAPRVALTGGCFQNRILCESAIVALRAAGIEPFWHRRVPPGDGGIAAGQALAAWYAKEG
ncbi:MAG: carbamoyltransferase HypF, partial [Chrysiogenetes bacterium]|nr:carbamoyltransferase HypF [Chrysiogenetes bacterium]